MPLKYTILLATFASGLPMTSTNADGSAQFQRFINISEFLDVDFLKGNIKDCFGQAHKFLHHNMKSCNKRVTVSRIYSKS